MRQMETRPTDQTNKIRQIDTRPTK